MKGVIRIEGGLVLMHINPPHTYKNEGHLENVSLKVEEGEVTVRGTKISYDLVFPWGADHVRMSEEDVSDYDMEKSKASWDKYSDYLKRKEGRSFKKKLFDSILTPIFGWKFPEKDFSREEGYAVHGWMRMKDTPEVTYVCMESVFVVLNGVELPRIG